MANLTIAVNCDTQDEIYGSSGVDWEDMVIAADELIFSAGSSSVIDGGAIPSALELSQAGTVISDIADTEVAKCFLSDAGAGVLREIHNFADNKRYVFAFSFDGATASEPVLELWDDENLNSANLNSLGAGVASNSWWRGEVTTNGLPGASWTGTQLAGNSPGYYLQLNDGSGALGSSGVLYCNLKIIIPAATVVSGVEQPILACKFTSN